MSIEPIDKSSYQDAQQIAAFQSNWQSVLSSVSGTLGLSAGALQAMLQTGSSLSSIAQTRGVSQQALVQSISSALIQSGQLSHATTSQVQQIAAGIANRAPDTDGADGSEAGAHGSPAQEPSGPLSTGPTGYRVASNPGRGSSAPLDQLA
jgi:hypothetical protein